MTMLSFRMEDSDAEQLQKWASRLGVDRSELMRAALRRHLVQLAAEHEIAAWETQPLSESEASFGQIADWGPSEDWSDWA